MQHLAKHLKRLHHARTGTVEILVAIGKVNARAQFAPTGARRHPMKLLFGAREIEPAWGDDDDVGIGVDELLPLHPGRMPARFAEQVDASSEFNQFRSPIT